MTKSPNFFDATKPRQFTLFLQITLLNCKFFSITGAPAFQTFNQSKGTVQLDNGRLRLVKSLESRWFSSAPEKLPV